MAWKKWSPSENTQIDLMIIKVISGRKKRKETHLALLFQKLWLPSDSASPCRGLCSIPTMSAEDECLFPSTCTCSHVAALNACPHLWWCLPPTPLLDPSASPGIPIRPQPLHRCKELDGLALPGYLAKVRCGTQRWEKLDTPWLYQELF